LRSEKEGERKKKIVRRYKSIRKLWRVITQG
jgi:hypothetical protein